MEKEKHFGEVQFKPTVLLDPVGYGGRLKVGEVFTGYRKGLVNWYKFKKMGQMENKQQFGSVTLEKREKVGDEQNVITYCLVQNAEGYNETINFASLQELNELHRRIGAFLQTQNC